MYINTHTYFWEIFVCTRSPQGDLIWISVYISKPSSSSLAHSFSGNFAGRFLQGSWRRCHSSSSGFGLSQFFSVSSCYHRQFPHNVCTTWHLYITLYLCSHTGLLLICDNCPTDMVIGPLLHGYSWDLDNWILTQVHTALKEWVSVRGDGAWMMGADVCLCS